MIIIICSALILSLFGQQNQDLKYEHLGDVLPTWIPVVFGIVTPLSFMVNGMLTKHLTS